MYIYTNSKLVNVFKQYNYKSISYTDKFEKKIEVLVKELKKKIEEYYTYIDKEENFNDLLNSLNQCLEQKTEESVEKVFSQIKLIKDEIIRNNINYAFFKVDNYHPE